MNVIVKQTAEHIEKNPLSASYREKTLARAYLNLLASMEGKVLVPEKPTEEILKAMEWQIGGSVDNPVKTWGTTKAIYEAMIAKTKDTCCVDMQKTCEIAEKALDRVIKTARIEPKEKP